MMGTATAAYQVEGAWNESGMPHVSIYLLKGDSSVTVCLHSQLLTTKRVSTVEDAG